MMFPIIATLFLLFYSITCTFAQDIDIGISISNGKIRNFYFSLSNYYRIPEEKIIIIKKKYPIIIEDELPVILLIIREAKVDPDIIIELRRRGYSWYDIMIRFGIYPEVIFRGYLDYGPPYGKAWGYHKKPKKIIFKDTDIIILSNIKFLSEYYHERPEIIIKYKEKHKKFIDVHDEIYREKKGKKERLNNAPQERFNGNIEGREREREQNLNQDRPGDGKEKREKNTHEKRERNHPKKDFDDIPPGLNRRGD